jgi:hypothetical protein
MIMITDLQTALLDLLDKIRDSDIKLIIGGGFGIYLKTAYVKRSNMRTLLLIGVVPNAVNLTISY